jgi:hypothetical protein
MHLQVGADEFGVLAHGLFRRHVGVPDPLRRRGARLEELALLDDPAVAVGIRDFFSPVTWPSASRVGVFTVTASWRIDRTPTSSPASGLVKDSLTARSKSTPQITRSPREVSNFTK